MNASWRTGIVWTLLCTGVGSVCASDAEALASITADGVRAHMLVLADDAMLGREAGTQGHRDAADYVAERFAQLGLEPAGDEGSYFQSVPLLTSRIEEDAIGLTLHRETDSIQLAFRDDFIRDGSFGPSESEIRAPLVFAGYGIRAPEYDHDDFAALDLRDKVAVLLSGAPPHFDTDQRAFYSSSAGKCELVTALGAVGLVFVRTPVDLERYSWERMLSGVGSVGMRWAQDDGAAFEGFEQLVGEATLSPSGAQKLFDLAGYDLDGLFVEYEQGRAGGFELGVDADFRQKSIQGSLSSPNVLAMIPGGDPELSDEIVLFTAHLDHLGVRPVDGEDSIHNGAYDNAAGVATILEIARAMAERMPAPRRSVLFAALTAEEKGLRGSSYLAHHPPVPIEQIVADINLDMPFLGYPIADVEGLGVEHSTLQQSLLRATGLTSLQLTPDTLPAQVRFIRSDQFSFVKWGVPALNLKPGSQSSDPAIDGAAMLDAFLHENYHRPSDDLDLPFDPRGAEAYVRTALQLGLFVCDDDERPRWNEGDFFGLRFGR